MSVANGKKKFWEIKGNWQKINNSIFHRWNSNDVISIFWNRTYNMICKPIQSILSIFSP